MPVESQAAFARRRGVSKQRISQYVKQGTLSGTALVERDGRLLIESDVAEWQLANRLDTGRVMDQRISVSAGRKRTPKPDAPADDGLPEDLKVIAAMVADVNDWRTIALGLLLFRSTPATAAQMALRSGASIAVAHCLYTLFSLCFVHDFEDRLKQLGISPEGLTYCLDLRDDLDWRAIAKERGEAYDPKAWKAWGAARAAEMEGDAAEDIRR